MQAGGGNASRTEESLRDADGDEDERGRRSAPRGAAEKAPHGELQQDEEDEGVAGLSDPPTLGFGAGGGGDERRDHEEHFEPGGRGRARAPRQRGEEKPDRERRHERLHLDEAV